MRFLLPLFLCLFTISAQATIHTVSNDVNNPAEYASVPDAYAAASPGDTLYVYGSPTAYDVINYSDPSGNSSFRVSKKIVIIGAGYAPQSTGTVVYPTKFNQPITLGKEFDLITGNLTSSPEGSKFIGLEAGIGASDSGGNSVPEEGISDIVIERCKLSLGFPQYVTTSNWQIINCHLVAGGVPKSTSIRTLGAVQNIVVSNCILTSAVEVSNVEFNNCIFLAMHENNWPFGGSGSGTSTFRNSIFINCNFNTYTFSNCNFLNNLTVLSPNTTFPIGNDNNVGSGNLSPICVGNNCVDDEDYHLETTSPGKLYGTDGTDIGIFGGAYPWPDASGFTGTPPIPQINVFNLLNTIVGPSDQLQFEAEAETQN